MNQVKKDPCELCKNQGKGGRKSPPHENLVKTGGQEINAKGKDASERYYKCATCGTEWIWEPGNYGMGWI